MTPLVQVVEPEAGQDGKIAKHSFDRLSQLETPFYLFDPDAVIAACADLREALGTGLVVSLKANSNVDLLMRCAHVLGDGLEVASLGELNVVVGRLSAPKYVNTPAADERLVLAASASRAVMVLDSPEQCRMVIGLRSQLRNPLPVMLRLNAGALLGDALPAARRDHFGMTPDEAVSLAAQLRAENFEVRGLHVFSGSFTFSHVKSHLAACMATVVEAVESVTGNRLSIVNLGSGLGDQWAHEGIDFPAYRQSLKKLAEDRILLHEAGRAVFAAAGDFVARVIATKEIGGLFHAVCDGGLAHAFRLAQTESVIRKRFAPTIVRRRTVDGASAKVRFVGNSCSPADVIGDAEAVPPEVGDFVVFGNCGAYSSYSPTGFLSLKPAQKYIVS